jgi:hypothetical protein
MSAPLQDLLVDGEVEGLKARDIFDIGMEVHATSEAWTSGALRLQRHKDGSVKQMQDLRGKVVGFCKSSQHIRVVPHGRNTPSSFHIKFWVNVTVVIHVCVSPETKKKLEKRCLAEKRSKAAIIREALE